MNRLAGSKLTDLNCITSHLETIENMAPSGFALGFHIRLTSSEFQFQAYPKKWGQIYSERGYLFSDPSIAWAMENCGAIRWSSLSDQDPLNIFGQAAEFGINFGTTIAVETKTSRSIAGISRPDREHTDAEVTELTDNVLQLHKLTASDSVMTENLRADLHRLSVKMTHPA